MRPAQNMPGCLSSCSSPGPGNAWSCWETCESVLPGCLCACRAQGVASPHGRTKVKVLREAFPSERDSPTASTLSSRQYFVWFVVASRTRRWSWVKSRTSWLGKTQTCRFPPAPRCHVETMHAVGTSLRNGEWGLAAPHTSCLGPSLRRGNVGHSTETSVSPGPFLCHNPLQGTIPIRLRDSQGPTPAAGCAVAAV